MCTTKNKKTMFAILVVSLMASLAVIGCASGDDPSDDGNGDNGGPFFDTGPLPDVGNGGGEEDTGSVQEDVGPCNASGWQGQMAGNGDHSGGTLSNDPSVLPEDTGIQAVRDYINSNKPNGCGPDQQDCTGTTVVTDTTLSVDGATVTATDFGPLGNAFFYVQDQQAGMYVRLDQAHPPIFSENTSDNVTQFLKVGSEVSFDVSVVGVYAGQPQIQGFAAPTNPEAGPDNLEYPSETGDSFNVTDTGKSVYVKDYTSEGASLAGEDYYTMVKIHGRLEKTGSCGSGWFCYNMMRDGENLVTVRSQENTQMGSNGYPENLCMTYVGPVGMFPGPVAENSTPLVERLQLEVENFAWTDF